MANTINHDHGSTGNKPPSGLNFSDGEFPNPEVFDWFWNQTVTTVNSHADQLDAIDSDGDGKVDRAEVADSATSYKGNDIDSDEDGKVDSAEQADALTAQYVSSVDGRSGAVSLRVPLRDKNGSPKFSNTIASETDNTNRSGGDQFQIQSLTVDVTAIAFINVAASATPDGWGDPSTGHRTAIKVNGTTVDTGEYDDNLSGSLILDVADQTSVTIDLVFDADGYLNSGEVTSSSIAADRNVTVGDIQ